MKQVELVLFHSFERSWFDTRTLQKLDTHITKVASYLVRNRYKVHFRFLTKGEDRNFRHVGGFPVSIHHIDFFGGLIPLELSQSLLNEAKLADPENPKIWHLNTYYYLMAAFIVPVLKRRGQKIVLHHRGGGWTLKGLPYYCLQYGLILPWICRKADVIIVQNSAEERKLTKFLRIPKHKIVKITNGVDCSFFKPLSMTLARKKLDLPASAPLMLFVGRIERTKGSRIVLDLADCLKHTKCQIALVGDGPDREWLENKAKERGVSHVLRFTGKFVGREELVQWYSAADMMIHPNAHGEGSPAAVLEAQACGLPVVAFDVPGVQDSISHGKTGFLVKKKNSNEFSLAAKNYLDIATKKETRLACRSWIKNKFNYESKMHSLEKVYESL